MENPLLSFYFICLLVLVSDYTNAQITANIDTVFITSNRIPQQAKQTGRNITILGQKAIAQSYATSLVDLLQYIPGIEVQSRNAFGVQGDITMRGSTFTQVLMLIDGMALNDPLTAHFNSNIPVAISEIDHIEILRGAAAAIYGIDAVGGVINIVTKGTRPNGHNQNDIEGEVTIGQNNQIQSNLGWHQSNDHSFFGGGISINQSDGETHNPKLLDGSDLESYNSDFDIKTIGLSAGYSWNNGWQIKGRSAYDYRDFSARYFYTTSIYDKSRETTTNWWNQIQLSKTGAKSSTNISSVYKYNTDRFVFSPDFSSTNNHVSQRLDLNISHLIAPSQTLSLRLGGQFNRRTITSNDRGDHSDNHTGLYIMTMLQPLEPLFITTSLRWDYDQNYGHQVSPQLNASILLKQLTLRGSIGRSLRAADYTERYVSYNIENLTPGRSLGNPNLEAEDSWSTEIGLDWQVLSNWKLKSTLFSRQSSRLIDYVPAPANQIPNNQNLQSDATYFYATNIADVSIQGIEVESWYAQPLSQNISLQWVLGYTHINSSNALNTISVYLSSHAKHLLTSQLIVSNPRWEISINSLLKVRSPRIANSIIAQVSDQYQLWNMRMRWHITDRISTHLQLHNLGNIQYQDILGAPMPGRWVGIGFKFKA